MIGELNEEHLIERTSAAAVPQAKTQFQRDSATDLPEKQNVWGKIDGKTVHWHTDDKYLNVKAILQ